MSGLLKLLLEDYLSLKEGKFPVILVPTHTTQVRSMSSQPAIPGVQHLLLPLKLLHVIKLNTLGGLPRRLGDVSHSRCERDQD